MRDVPFLKQEGEKACFQTVIGMVLKYFDPRADVSQERLSQLTGSSPHLWTWPLLATIRLQTIGYEIVFIEGFDYRRFSIEGEAYLYEQMGQEAADAQIRNSDIPKEMKNAETLGKQILIESREPTMGDLRRLSKDGFLIHCGINAGALCGGSYVSHSVLVIDVEDTAVTFHDPGGEGRPYANSSLEVFDGAWSGISGRDRNLIAFRKTMA